MCRELVVSTWSYISFPGEEIPHSGASLASQPHSVPQRRSLSVSACRYWKRSALRNRTGLARETTRALARKRRRRHQGMTWASQHQVLLERSGGAQWACQWRPLLLLHLAHVSATELPKVLYSNLQIHCLLLALDFCSQTSYQAFQIFCSDCPNYQITKIYQVLSWDSKLGV